MMINLRLRSLTTIIIRRRTPKMVSNSFESIIMSIVKYLINEFHFSGYYNLQCYYTDPAAIKKMAFSREES